MKQIITTLFAAMMAIALWAQAPQAFNYQAVVRDANGNLLENQAVGIKISLLQGSATGQEVYAETHATTTNQFGQVDLKIGTGTTQTGQFGTIAWGAGPYYLQLAVDLTGGANFAVMGTTQMLSVPYALYAEEGSGWEKNANGISYLNGKVGIGVENAVSNFQINGTSLPNFIGEAKGILSVSAAYQPNYFTAIDFLYNPWSKPTARIAAFHSGSGSKLMFGTSDTYDSGITNTAMTIDKNGRVGIGTSDPSTELEVKGSINISSATNAYVGLFQNNNVNLTLGSTSGSQPRIYLYGSASPTSPGSIYIAAPSHISLMGNIGINTTNPTYPLTVNGTIRSKKVIVDTGWSDFVFEDDYKLMPLHEVEAFIKTNRHLPEIPSAGEVEENGVSLGEISASLLQKIEELTLYAIEQQKKIDDLEKEVKNLKKRRNRR